jgi:hypothetical protein
MQWHEALPQRWTQEQSIAAGLLQEFEAGIDGNGCSFIRGAFSVISEHGHVYETVRLRLVYPPTFPARNQSPLVYLESHRDRWVNRGDSHIESDWRLCLFVPSESGIVFDDPTSLNDLFAVIHTFLFKQRIYQRRLLQSQLKEGKAKWPGEDRSHGLQGIREAVRDSGGVGRNDPCPCGSGRKFKHCHLGTL